MVEEEEFPPQMLADMRMVYDGRFMPPGGFLPRHLTLQRELEENPKVFHDRLAGLEKEWLSHQRRKVKTDAASVLEDEGTDTSRVVLERVIGELLKEAQK